MMLGLASNIWRLIRNAALQWIDDNPFQLAAAVAYYTLFSLAPLLSICIAIGSLFFNEQAVQGHVLNAIQGIIGLDSARVVEATLQAAHQEAGAGVLASGVSLVVLLVGATAVVGQLQQALNQIWGVKSDSRGAWMALVKDRLFSFAVIVGIGFLLIVSLVVSTTLSALTARLRGLEVADGFLWQSMDLAVSLIFLTLLFALIYRLLPDVEVAWRDVIVGSLITSLLFTAGKFAIGFYIGRTSLSSIYGAAGSLVTLLLWVYYSALIFFFGAEVTQVFAKLFGRGVTPTPLARVECADRAEKVKDEEPEP